MEEQRRFLITITLVLIIMAVYSYFFQPQREPVESRREEKAEAITKKEEIIPEEIVAPDESKTLYNIKKESIKTPLIQAILSNQGACIKDLYLTKKDLLKDKEGFHLLSSIAFSEGSLLIKEFNGRSVSDVVYKKEKLLDNKVVYSCVLDGKIKVTKTFIFHNSNYSIDLQIKFTNLTESDKIFSYTLIGASRINREGYLDRRFTNGGAFVKNEIRWQRLPKKPQEQIEILGDIQWLILRDSYYSAIIKPHHKVNQAFIVGLNQKKERGINWATGLVIDKTVLSSHSSITHKYTFYAGPTTRKDLRLFGLEEATHYGKLNIICQILIKTLNFFYDIFRNYGIAIIMLVALINIFTYPLTLKNIKSMRRLQAVQPHIARLREIHKDDQHKLQTEIMKLYREHNANPLGGCLPMLIQAPIFIALYITLARSAELKGSNFLWIKDLSRPDALARLPFNIPLLGDSFNLLPIIMVFAMIVQQRITIGIRNPTEGDSQTQQQQRMMLFMPIFFGILLYNLPSGLILYWTVNTIFMAAMHYVIQRRLSSS